MLAGTLGEETYSVDLASAAPTAFGAASALAAAEQMPGGVGWNAYQPLWGRVAASEPSLSFAALIRRPAGARTTESTTAGAVASSADQGGRIWSSPAAGLASGGGSNSAAPAADHPPLGYVSWTDVKIVSAPATVTPEPVSMALLGVGLAGVAAARRRRPKPTRTD